MEENPRGKATFSLGQDYIKLLDELAEETKMNKSQIIRYLMDRFAVQLKKKPVNKLYEDISVSKL